MSVFDIGANPGVLSWLLMQKDVGELEAVRAELGMINRSGNAF